MDNYIEDGEDALRETAERGKTRANTRTSSMRKCQNRSFYLVKELLIGYDVVVLDNMSTGKESFLAKKATLVRGDCRDYETVFKTIEEHEPFVVFQIKSVAFIEERRGFRSFR